MFEALVMFTIVALAKYFGDQNMGNEMAVLVRIMEYLKNAERWRVRKCQIENQRDS